MRMRGVAGLRRSGREMAVLVLFVLVWFDDLRYTALRESSWEGRCMEHAGGDLAGVVGTVLAFLGEAVFNGNMPCFFCLWLKGWGLGGCIVGAGVGYGHGHRGCIPILRSRYLGGVDVGGSLISLHIYIHDLVHGMGLHDAKGPVNIRWAQWCKNRWYIFCPPRNNSMPARHIHRLGTVISAPKTQRLNALQPTRNLSREMNSLLVERCNS